MADLQIIDSLVESGEIGRAIDLLSEYISSSPRDAQLYFYRGRLNWRLGNRPAAMGDYARAVELDPASPAVHALEQAREIAAFFNPDLYNP